MTEETQPFSGVHTLLVDLDGTLLGANDLSLGIDFVVQAIRAARQFAGTRKAIAGLRAVNRALQGKPSPEQEGKTNAVKAFEAFAGTVGMGVDQAEAALVQGAHKIFPTLARHFFPIRGAKEFIDWARNHYPLILATNPVWPREIVEMRIRWAGFDPAIFRRITLAREMSAAKPWLTYYEEILKQEKMEASQCLLIGNDMKKDLAAAEVGIRVFITDPNAKLCKRLPVKNGTAAYRGTFQHLRRMLEACV